MLLCSKCLCIQHDFFQLELCFLIDFFYHLNGKENVIKQI